MNKSIRSKLFISITFLLIFFVLVLCILNNLYLQQYYINNKKSILKENAKNLISMYTGNPEDIQDELDRTANITGGSIDIRDRDGKTVYMSSRRLPNEKNIMDNNRDKPGMQPPMNQPTFNEKFNEYTEGEYTFENRRDVQLKVDFLTLVTKLNNGDILAIRVPLVSISESVDIANRFIIMTGIFIAILGSIWAFLFSKKFTQPILEVNNVARNMAKFDFSEKCKIREKMKLGNLVKVLITYLVNLIQQLQS